MKKSTKNIQNAILIFSIVCYIIIMIYALFLKSQPLNVLFSKHRIINRSVCYVPFDSIRTFIANLSGGFKIHAINNLFGNILLFIPLGIYLELLRKKPSIIKSAFAVFLTSLAVEIIQYVFGLGISDIDDIILNTAGGIVGILILRTVSLFFSDKQKLKTFFTILSLLLSVAAIGFIATAMVLYLSFS